ncbi:MAG: threonine/serine dehydratase [Alphaproteobacteria bacterium]
MTSSPNTETGRARLPDVRDVEGAARRLRGKARLTPLLESALLNAETGARLLIKAEPLQLTGSFKFRGAYNRISRIRGARRAAGVLAYSSGNHAQGVAAAAHILGLPAVIVMPDDAPAAKIEGTRFWGAEIVLYDRRSEDREALARRLTAERRATLVPPYDDRFVIAGQGTVGREIAAQARALGAALDLVLVPCGGGGLIAGCALALEHASPGTPIYAVEPEAHDDTKRSLEAGRRTGASSPEAQSICDALRLPMPGMLTFAINRARVAGGLVVTDGEVARAMAAAFRHLKLVLEPSGAVALAAALSGRIELRGKTVAIIASGGNVDPRLFCDAICQDSNMA